MSWAKSLALVVQLEGGYVLTNPPEGPTFCGVLKPYYDSWCVQHGRDAVWPPTEEAVASYYHDAYWTPFHCGDFPDDADAVAFQMVVNLPSVRARQLLQLAVGAFPDGVLGPQTLTAIRNWTAQRLEDNLLLAQQTHYCDVRPTTDDNFRGLLDRVERTRKFLAG